jgi:hypothetical protein
MENDLSHVYANDPDEGQKHHGDLPDELLDHLASAFAHKAGVGKNPGIYKGPKVTPPSDWETPKGPAVTAENKAAQGDELAGSPSQEGQSAFDEGQMAEKQAIESLSVPQNPRIPAPKKSLPSKNPDWSDLAGQ